MDADPPSRASVNWIGVSRRVSWFLLVRVPCILAASMAAFLLAAAAVWWLELAQTPWSAAVSALILFGSYGLAGIVWGLRRIVHLVGTAAVELFSRKAAGPIDTALDSLIARSAAGNKGLETAAVRQHWNRVVGQSVQPEGDAERPGSWTSLPIAVLRRLALRLFRIPTAGIERILADLEQRGETHVSPSTLRGELRDRMIALAVGQARWKLALWNAAGYLLVAVCLLIPFVTAWLARSPGQ